MSRRRPRKVPKSTKEPLKNVPSNPLVANSTRDSVWFDLHSNKWLTSVKVGNFTNFLFNRDEYIGMQFEILHTVIPKVIEEWKSIIGRGGQHRHCHRIEKEAKSQVHEVFQEIFGYPIGDEVDVWQFGFTGSLRLVCINNPSENTLIPIFVDYHHLLSPDVKYNKRNFERYSYCPVCDFIKRKY